MASVQQEVQAKRKSQIKSMPAHIMAGGDVQEHNTPYPPPPQKGGRVDALNKKREESGRSGDGGAPRR